MTDRAYPLGTGIIEIRINGITQRPKINFEIVNDPDMDEETWNAVVRACTGGSMFMVTQTKHLEPITPEGMDEW